LAAASAAAAAGVGGAGATGRAAAGRRGGHCPHRPDGDPQRRRHPHLWPDARRGRRLLGDNGSSQSADQTGPYTQVSAGDLHTCALTPAGAVDCWGENGSDQSADQTGPYTQVSAGGSHTCVLTPTGAVDCWGNDSSGQATDQTGPYTQVSAGSSHTCALTPAGAVDCWGENIYDQADDQTGPYTQVSAGGSHTCALTSAGAVDCWGDNFYDQANDQTGPFGPFEPPTGSIKVIKTVVGDAPGGDWSFSGSAPINAFTLAAAGGNQTFSDLTPGSFTITETRQGGWVPSVSCTPGDETGVASVTLDVAAGEAAECTFTNTQCQPGTFDNGGDACVPAPAGSFVSTAGATSAELCPAGRWQDQEGQTSCNLADPGFFVPEPGATVQTQCPQGTTSGAGATECTPIQSAGFCPAQDPAVDTLRTDLIGIGMRSRSARLTVPNYGDVESLYGQLAAVDIGVIKWVQFLQKGESPIKVPQVTSPAVDPATIRWWGTDLSADPAARWVRGLFTPGKNGGRSPRAFVLWPTYDTGDESYANAFETFDSPGNYVHQSTTTLSLDLPPTAAPGADVTVNLALVDVNNDKRVVILTVEAGGVSETRTINRPNRRNILNIETFTLSGVPAGTDEVTITLESPPVGGQYPFGGDSAAMIGASANYACGEVSPP
jgi:hypothetical protein